MTGNASTVCIVGGGIAGLAIGYELARRGQAVTVLEAAAVGERAAAGVAAGMLAPYAEASVAHPDLTRLAVASHDEYPAFIETLESIAGIPAGFDRAGTLFVSAHRDHIPALQQLDAFHRDRGLRAQRLTGPEAREREPALSPAVSAGLFLADDWQVDPRRLLRALAAAIHNLGGSVRERAPVRAVERSPSGYSVTVDGQEPISAGRVVLAAGAWTNEVASGTEELPLRPVRGEILRLRGERLLQHVVRTPDVYLVPREDGELVVGGTSEERGFDERLRAGSVYDLLHEAYRVVPAIYDLELAETSVGFRPALRDHLPALGYLDGDGLLVATGHYRNGVELAPVTARLAADLLCEGRSDALLEPLDPRRFAPAQTAGATSRH